MSNLYRSMHFWVLNEVRHRVDKLIFSLFYTSFVNEYFNVHLY
jgi:hypothetical protein